MRIAVVGINYAPEPTGISVYTTGMAEGLVAQGDSVRVVTGFPHYPQWRIHPDFHGVTQRRRRRGVQVQRLRHHVPRRPRLLNRAVMEVQFGLRALAVGWGRPDVVVLVTPALLSSALGLLRARLTRRPTCVWVQDIYSLGVSESGTGGGLAARVLRRVESAVLGSADAVVVIHERFRRYIVEELGVAPERVHVVRNWSHLPRRTGRDRAGVRRSRGWTEDDVVVLHSGNMGAKQGLENVVRAAAAADRRGSALRFVLLGDGNQRAALEAMPDRGRLQFLDPLGDDEYLDTLHAADLLLVNERPGLTEMSVPSKLTSYFSTGLAVIGATDVSSVTAEELALSGGGVRVDAADPESLVTAAEELAGDEDARSRLGRAGLAFSEQLLEPARAIREFRAVLAGIVRR